MSFIKNISVYMRFIVLFFAVASGNIFGSSSFVDLVSSSPIFLSEYDTNIVISGKRFFNITNDGTYAINVSGTEEADAQMNLEIKNCLFENVRWAIHVYGACHVNIHGNRFVNCGDGIVIDNSQNVKIEYNEFTEIGTYKILNHGYGDYWAQNAGYFINVRGTNNSISYNIFDYGSKPAYYLEDIFGLWNSGGTPFSFCRIVGNKIRGGIPGSETGTGIIAGDAYGATEIYAHYILIQSNIMINSQDASIGIAGGGHMIIADNKGFMSLEHSRKLTQHPYNSDTNPYPGGGIMIFDYSHIGCSDFHVTGNEMYAVRSDNVANPWWFDTHTCTNLYETNNLWHWDLADHGNVSETMLPNDIFDGLDFNYFSGRHFPLTASNIGPYEIYLHWTIQINASGYKLYRAFDGCFSNARLLRRLSGRVSSVTDYGLHSAKTYYYWIQATNSKGEGPSGSAVETVLLKEKQYKK